MTLVRVKMQINSSECRFTLIWSHLDSSLASKCHLDPTSKSKGLLIKVETTHWSSIKINDPPNNSVKMTPPDQKDSFEFTVYKCIFVEALHVNL